MKSSVSQIKNSLENMASRLDKVEERITDFVDNVDELEHSNKDLKT
jgi:chaperonin cofactor prefoldin